MNTVYQTYYTAKTTKDEVYGELLIEAVGIKEAELKFVKHFPGKRGTTFEITGIHKFHLPLIK